MTEQELKARFDALPHCKQRLILDKHRDIEVDYNWWEDTYDHFTELMEEMGIEVRKSSIQFSGFWSQGDGASFRGSIENWPLFLSKHDLLPEYQVFLDLLPHTDISFVIASQGRYNHSGSMRGELEWDCANWCEEDSLRHTMVQVLINHAEEARETLEAACTEAFKDHANDLYKSLEEEYEHLTSDETVLECLIADELIEEEIDACDTDE